MITVGGINFTDAIVNLEFEVQRTQRILDWILQNNHGLVAIPKSELDRIASESLSFVQQKYPSAGIAPREGVLPWMKRQGGP